MRRATGLSLSEVDLDAISIHALREESDAVKYINSGICIDISIHALREESDFLSFTFLYVIFCDFNPRSPWGERLFLHIIVFSLIIFQSTLSVRRATNRCWVTSKRTRDFNPRSPWGERHTESKLAKLRKSKFQSTLSVRRATKPTDMLGARQVQFQSTLSVRRATVWGVLVARWLANFNPRSPWGERPINVFLFVLTFLISIHALREESDLLSGKPCLSPNLHFNPRSPWGERQSQEVGGGLKSGIKFISIHALREESDKPS